MIIKKVNPDSVAAPVRQYSHVTIVPRHAELVVLSGLVCPELRDYIKIPSFTKD
ncbi:MULTISPECIES: hypothetical protein [unclassified Bacillus (in: firmicutes)]|uniref:hypothetical protein n=1 Tax=unclassified Bacillus (in: firmicutes) TaxID=185979 RepID=UPI001596BEB8|nr:MULTISPECIES: hypothetical protein [unclassified Bacillus (in: firmicutes)]